MKLPAFQFYPADWRKDPGIQSLSYHDRGVWWEILCLMHESDQRGKLLLNGNPIPEDALARLLHLDKQSLTKAISTFIETGVASIDQDTGALMNRRMVRDEKIRKIRSEVGKLGGNPALLNQNSSKEEAKVNQTVNQKPTPSVPSSASSSEDTPIPPPGAGRSWIPNSEQLRLNALYGRKSTTAWDAKMLKAWRKITPIDEEELRLVERFHAVPQIQGKGPWKRTNLETLLNHFSGEVERARGWFSEHGAPGLFSAQADGKSVEQMTDAEILRASI